MWLCIHTRIWRYITTGLSGMALGLSGCSSPSQIQAIPASQPAFYISLADASARIDAGSALSLINGYRQNLNLAKLSLDEGLMREAEARADQHARSQTIADGSRAAGEGGDMQIVNMQIVSAGYYTMSDAFSGWRSSPTHDRKLRQADARRMGIATAYSPGSKYKVYWVLILAR